MTHDDDFAMEGLKSLRRAVADALERKRLLGQYAVFWRDGRVVFEGPDAPDLSEQAENLEPGGHPDPPENAESEGRPDRSENTEPERRSDQPENAEPQGRPDQPGTVE